MSVLVNGKYNKNNWVEPITPTKEKMDNIENALSYAIDMNVEYKTIINQEIDLSTDKFQYLEIDKNITINLPTLEYDTMIHLFLNCTQECKLKFNSSGDEESIYLKVDLYDIEIIYIGEWIIKI